MLIIAICFCVSCSTRVHHQAVSIQPFGTVSPQVLDSVSAALREFYGFRPVILRPQSLPQSFINYEKGKRYSADSILSWLDKHRDDTTLLTIGITGDDIYTSKRDGIGNYKQPESKYRVWGIFGLGRRPGHSCVISTYRLHHRQFAIEMNRIQKVALHEAGHNLGLRHCSNRNCFMTDAMESIKTIDRENKSLCPACRRKIGLE